MKIDIGKKVKVVLAADETCSLEHVKKTGIVTAHNGNRQTGNTPKDPLHIVGFKDGSVESFWFEELKVMS